MTKRDELAAWLAEMPDADIEALWGVACRLRVTMAPQGDDPAGFPNLLVDAPVDEEPLSDDDRAVLAGADAGLVAGVALVPAEEMRRRILG